MVDLKAPSFSFGGRAKRLWLRVVTPSATEAPTAAIQCGMLVGKDSLLRLPFYRFRPCPIRQRNDDQVYSVVRMASSLGANKEAQGS